MPPIKFRTVGLFPFGQASPLKTASSLDLNVIKDSGSGLAISHFKKIRTKSLFFTPAAERPQLLAGMSPHRGVIHYVGTFYIVSVKRKSKKKIKPLKTMDSK